jgi:hypothetical protein
MALLTYKMMDSMLYGCLVAVGFSLLGELLPSAICHMGPTKSLAIGASLSWLLYIMLFLNFCFAVPIGMFMDLVFKHEEEEKSNTDTLIRQMD